MISCVILTKNSSKTIQNAIHSAKFTNQIIVVDDHSTDNTRSLAKSHGAQVFTRSLQKNFAIQRNFAITKTKHPWVLFLDSDEIVPAELASEISKAIISTTHSGFYIKRLDNFLGTTLHYGEAGSTKLLRLAKKSAGTWARPVHEHWQISGSVGQLVNPIIHHPHESISDFLTKINFYTDIESDHRTYKQAHLLLQTITYPLGKFTLNFIIKRGFLDGFPGLASASIMSLHSLIVRVKIYEKTIQDS